MDLECIPAISLKADSTTHFLPYRTCKIPLFKKSNIYLREIFTIALFWIIKWKSSWLLNYIYLTFNPKENLYCVKGKLSRKLLPRKIPLENRPANLLKKRRDSGTDFFLWILRNFEEYLLCRTPLVDCFYIVSFSFSRS